MAGTLRSRLNHYQVLRVSPEATGDEIARAFATEGNVFRPQLFGNLAELCIAFETLRDPIKRRAYDASLGLEREEKPPTWPAAARPRLVVQFPVATAPVERQPPPSALPPASQPTPQRTPEPLAKTALPLRAGAGFQATPQPRIARGDAPRLAPEEELGAEARPTDWKRAATALGTVIVAACFLAGLAGWWSASAVGEAAQPINTVSVTLPPAKFNAALPAQETMPAPLPTVPKARIDRPKPVIAAASPAERTAIASEPPAVVEQPQSNEAGPTPIGQTVEEAPTTSTAAAMPLSDRMIARTIQRIGYSCGSVASTAPVEGETPGVFKVTCSSGQSYKASPVNGRYHFRRWGRSYPASST